MKKTTNMEKVWNLVNNGIPFTAKQLEDKLYWTVNKKSISSLVSQMKTAGFFDVEKKRAEKYRYFEYCVKPELRGINWDKLKEAFYRDGKQQPVSRKMRAKAKPKIDSPAEIKLTPTEEYLFVSFNEAIGKTPKNMGKEDIKKVFNLVLGKW